MRKKAFWSVIIVFAFLVVGFGHATAETLSLLTWKGYAPKNLIEKFQKETGIEVKSNILK